MRTAFIEQLIDLAQKNEKIVLLTADLGYGVLEKFAEQFPKRFFNVGVAEQNMIGVATGMAEAGFVPFVYSTVSFSVLRPYEFIKNGPIAHRLPVRIIGVGGGFDYGYAGPTHFGLEDIALLRVYKDIEIVVPADIAQVKTALLNTWNEPQPVYYRLGKGESKLVPCLQGRFEKGKTYQLTDGKDLLCIVVGTMAMEAYQSVGVLNDGGVSAKLILVSDFCQNGREELSQVIRQYKRVVTIEDHYENGGLGSYVAEIIAEDNLNVHLCRCAVREQVRGALGPRNYMLDRYGLSPEKIVERIKVFLKCE